jgi:hypothetical protein
MNNKTKNASVAIIPFTSRQNLSDAVLIFCMQNTPWIVVFQEVPPKVEKSLTQSRRFRRN